jgi:hypothetical protein
MEVWNDEACAEIAGGLVRTARERGTLTILPFALNYSAAHRVFAGDFDIAEQLVDEADAITTATRNVGIAESGQQPLHSPISPERAWFESSTDRTALPRCMDRRRALAGRRESSFQAKEEAGLRARATAADGQTTWIGARSTRPGGVLRIEWVDLPS